MHTSVHDARRRKITWHGLALLIPIALALTACATARDGVPGARGTAARIADLANGDYCAEHLRTSHHSPAAGGLDAVIGEIRRFQELAERALAYRQQAIEVATRLQARIDAGRPLSGGDLEIMRQGSIEYLAMREDLWKTAVAHECWLDLDERDPRRRELAPDVHRGGLMLSLAAALVLYDNYLLAASIYEQDDKLRRTLDRPDAGYGLSARQLTALKMSALSAENRERLARGVAYYRARLAPLRHALDPPELVYLAQLITQSPSYNAQTRDDFPRALRTELGAFRTVSVDLLNSLAEEGLGLFSMMFGNTLGLVETRRGRLYHRPEVHDALVRTLRPGDILLEKTPFRLTDLAIPGYWGHAAVWVGGEDELRALGIWDHPAVKPHQAAVRRQGRIVEALRSGVKLSTLEKFLNVDDLLVLRAREPDARQQAERVLRAFRQLGKAYDFNFDVETTDRIVCSELIYQVYTEIDWPTTKALGRATISPDQVARRALGNQPLRVVAFYQDGRQLKSDADRRLAEVLGVGGGSPFPVGSR